KGGKNRHNYNEAIDREEEKAT
ncbi:MAG: hypothetical protein HW396_1836, partial [Candidatus Dadabacteria bacterium]|nr:hypothetical protein [Candidatus Dadabacteria bacterium]